MEEKTRDEIKFVLKAIENLEKENQKLNKEHYETLISWYKLKKALDILKEKVYLKVKKYCKEDYENPYKLEVEMDYSYDLTQKDFELLKEVF